MARDEQPCIVQWRPKSSENSLTLLFPINSGLGGESSTSSDESSFVYGNLYKGLKGLIAKRGSLNGSRDKCPELGGPLTYSVSSIMRKNEEVCHEDENRELIHNDGKIVSGIRLCMTKVTRRKRMRYYFQVDDSKISWNHGKKEILLDNIKDIRVGEMASTYMDMYGVNSNVRDLWMTVIYTVSKNKLKALHVLADCFEDFLLFFQTVEYFSKSRRRLMEEMAIPNNAQFANIHWQTNVSSKKEDEDKDTLSFNDVKRLCNHYHIYCSDSYLHNLFRKADTNQNELLNFPEFQKFVGYLKKRPEVEVIWNNLRGSKENVDFDAFLQFLREIQGETISESRANKVFKFYSGKSDFLDFDGLLKFISDQPFFQFEEQDYSKPLSQYFISSSHNTYLVGKQVADVVSVEGYIQALQQGCRCVEIDIWDGEHGPIVCHGMFTPSIPLEDVVKTIRKYAFITTPYPLILSLEIHCRYENQILITKIISEVLGELLYAIPPHKPLPSPSQLKNKIILKSKNTQRVNVDLTSGSGSSYTSSSWDSLSESTETNIIIEKKASIRQLKLSKKVTISEKLLDLSGIHGVPFRNFSLSESKTPAHCFSFNEKKFNALYKDESQRMATNKHNRRHLMRVYPHILRYKSSNFNPIRFWSEGVQMAATNWQTYDLGQQINNAMFQVSYERTSIWHAGYVLKPSYLRKDIHKTKDIPLIMKSLRKKKVKLSLTIISGQMLPLQDAKVLAPSIVVDLICSEDLQDLKTENCLPCSDSNRILTKSIKDNGFNPVWNAVCKCTLIDDELNFVRFTLKSGNQTAAISCIRLSYLKKGYRYVPLYNSNGEKFIFSTLFLHIDQYHHEI